MLIEFKTPILLPVFIGVLVLESIVTETICKRNPMIIQQFEDAAHKFSNKAEA